MTTPLGAQAFDQAHYAASPWRKVARCFQLGPKYFLSDVPKYLHSRWRLGLAPIDSGVWVNPLRELSGRGHCRFPCPPAYGEALWRCAAAGVRLSLPPHRLAGLAGAWWATRRVHGDVVEFGAYQGATALFLAVLARLHGVGKRTIMLDTFEGIPHTSAFDPSRAVGDFRPLPGQVETILRAADDLGVSDSVEVHKGLFEESFPLLRARDQFGVSFAHVDANTYLGTWDACRFVIPATTPRGVIVFDDYNGVYDLGARLAIDCYLNRSGLRPRPLAGISAFIQVPDS